MQKPTPTRFRFGPFEANIVTGYLFENGKRVPLQEKPFQLLAAILLGLGNVVTREDAAAMMWPDTHVQTNQGLNAAIRKVRLALGDSSERSKYIETLGSRGYRFIHSFEVIGWSDASKSLTAASALRVAVLPTEDTGGVMQDQVREFSGELSSMLRNQAPQVTVVSNGDLKERNLEGRAIEEIGRALQVEFVVAARVRLIQNKLRLTAMLFQADDTQCIWAETYEHAPEDFVKQRTALVDEVVRSLRLKIMQKPD